MTTFYHVDAATGAILAQYGEPRDAAPGSAVLSSDDVAAPAHAADRWTGAGWDTSRRPAADTTPLTAEDTERLLRQLGATAEMIAAAKRDRGKPVA
jgi:hypothetical protein